MTAGASTDSGIDRRTLIRRAAIVGAAAWTAPVIVGSLSSPAAAVTAPRGCNVIGYNGNCNPNSNQANNECSPAIPGGCNVLPAACLSPTTSNCSGTTATVTFQLNAGCSCTITQAGAKAAHTAQQCVAPTSNNGSTVVFPILVASPPAPPAANYVQFSFLLTCG